jgi:hypothetical protein
LTYFQGGGKLRQRALCVFTIGFVVSGLSQAVGQDFPKVLRIDREEIKQGKEAAHEKLETQYARVISKAKFVPYLALTAETGPNEVWFVEGHDSYASIENMMQLTDKEPLRSQLEILDTQDGEFKVNSHSMVAVLQPDLSFPATPIPGGLSKVRYFEVIVQRLRVGYDPEWRELMGIEKAGYSKVARALPEAVYTVTWGAPSGTRLLVIPMVSPKSFDPIPGETTFAQAIGTEMGARRRKLRSEILMSEEANLFSVNPRMSNPSKETVDGDPAFWAPKPAAAKKTGAQ